MSEGIGLIDRLQDRSLIDRYGFMLFAALGSLLILAAKHFSVDATFVSVAAVAIMVLYAIIVNARGTGKLRSDQAGDNCYYLGLIFTLTSLAYAIFTFDPDDTATTIVQGFGVALATTVVGLVLRVFFNQSRVDLYEIEESARLELTMAAGALRAELSQITLQIKDFTLGLQQSVEEVRDQANESIATAATSSVEAVRTLAGEVTTQLASQTSALATSANDLAKKTSSVSRSIERYSASVDEIAGSHEVIVGDVGRMAETTKKMTEHSQAILEQTRAVKDLQAETNLVMANAGETANRLKDGMAAALSTIQRFETQFSVRLDALEAGPKQTTDKALAAIAKAADAVDAAMGRLAIAQEAAINSVGGRNRRAASSRQRSQQRSRTRTGHIPRQRWESPHRTGGHDQRA